MTRRPAFMFYPGDERRDAELQSCSIGARGLWHEMLCIMHECTPYGELRVNEKPMSVAQLARLVGMSERDCAVAVRELEVAGVPSRTPDGALYSRRMVRDEAVRAARAAGGQLGAEHGSKGAEHGSKGGRPRNTTGVDNPPSVGNSVSQKPAPSSSSSSSSSPSSSKKEKPDPPLRGFELTEQPDSIAKDFEAFWSEYPRKKGKQDAEKVFRQIVSKGKATAEELIEAASRCAADCIRAGTEPKFIKYPAGWLRAGMWKDEAESRASARSNNGRQGAVDYVMGKFGGQVDRDD